MLLSYRGISYDVMGGMSPGRLHILHVKGVSTKGIVDGSVWDGLVACVGTFQYRATTGGGKTVLSCRPLPSTRPPLTKAEFVTVLRSGFELVVWKKVKDGKVRDRNGKPKWYQKKTPVP